MHASLAIKPKHGRPSSRRSDSRGRTRCADCAACQRTASPPGFVHGMEGGAGVGWLDGGLGAHPSYASCHKRYTCTWPHANAIPSCSVNFSPCYAFSACSRLAQGQTFKLSIPAAHVRRQQQRAHRLRACLWRSSRRWLVPARLVSEESAQDRFGEGGTHVRDGPLGRGPVVVAE